MSGDKPKIPNVIKSLQLFLGPGFMTDIITVETADHARLSLKLSYNWSFQYDKDVCDCNATGVRCSSSAFDGPSTIVTFCFTETRNVVKVVLCA